MPPFCAIFCVVSIRVRGGDKVSELFELRKNFNNMTSEEKKEFIINYEKILERGDDPEYKKIIDDYNEEFKKEVDK